MYFICSFCGISSCVFVTIHRVLKNKCDLFALPLQQLSACLLIVAYFLICSTFAAHSQHAHANGLFNNGAHFDEAKMLIFNK